MKQKGFTLIELVVVMGLIVLVMPLIYGIYTSGIKQSNHISDTVDTQVAGARVINQINTDFRLAKLASVGTNYHSEVQKNFDSVDDYLTANGMTAVYYIESLSSTMPILYATKSVTGSAVELYRISLKDSGVTKAIQLHQMVSPRLLTDANIIADFPKVGLTDLDSFEEYALYTADKPLFSTNRSTIEIASVPDLSDGTEVIQIPADLNNNSHFVVLGCFMYDSSPYVYFMHDTTGEKYYGSLVNYDKQVGSYTVDPAGSFCLLTDAYDFSLKHTGITYNLSFKKKINKSEQYSSFNIDVDPLYLGGGEK